MGVGLARIVEGIEVCRRACRQYALILRSELIRAHGQNRQKSFFLSESQSVHRNLGAGQLHANLALQFLEGFEALGLQLDEHRAMQKWLFVAIEGGGKLHHVLKVALGFDGIVYVIGNALHLVLAGGILNDAPLLHVFDETVIDAERNTAFIGKGREDRQFLGGGRILTDHPRRAIAVAYDIVVGHKLDRAGEDAVEEVLCADFLQLFLGQHLGLSLKHYASPPSSSRY